MAFDAAGPGLTATLAGVFATGALAAAALAAVVSATGALDTTTFSRVVKGFVIQGGFLGSRSEPLDEKQQSFVRTMPPEFNPTLHERGILSMAHGDDPASATSSFFIVLARNQGLDNQYTVFGRVIEGMDVVDKIGALPKVGGDGADSDQPLNPEDAKILSVRIVPR